MIFFSVNVTKMLDHLSMQNCGECGEVPCKIWFDTRDPKFSDEEFNENIAMRVQALKKE